MSKHEIYAYFIHILMSFCMQLASFANEGFPDVMLIWPILLVDTYPNQISSLLFYVSSFKEPKCSFFEILAYTMITIRAVPVGASLFGTILFILIVASQV